MTNAICGLCLQPWHEGHDCNPGPQNPNITYGHRLAIMLECMLLDPPGSAYEAHQLLNEYKAETQRRHEYLERML